MADFLLELLSEEIPARMQAKAADDLRWAFETELRTEAALSPGTVRTFVTPRRLALLATDIQTVSELQIEEIKGPKVGAPQQALDGFLRKAGVAQDMLFEKADAKGVLTWFAQKVSPPRSLSDVIAIVLPRIVQTFPWPKAMRWGAASLSTESPRWVRPLQGVVALLDDAVVPVEIAGIASGRETAGHRFLHSGPVTIGHAAAYAETLRAAHVIVDAEERRRIVRDGARACAEAAGLELVEDEGLVAENAGLTEWPVPLLGCFDPAFLSVPPEVIQLTARVNQKYFVCRDASGALADAFVCTANIAASDGGRRIVEGNRKVLAARLSDARFFYETDRKVPLAEQAKKLDRIVFHEKLGTVADKAARVARLARWLVEEGIVKSSPSELGEHLASLAEQAALLCKADLVTGMVGEFPELQGVMGGYYARAEGLPDEVADAIRDHYKPVGQGDAVPTAPVTVAVSLADKLDTIAAFFAIEEKPTGSKDPFALRRAALGLVAILLSNQLRLSLERVLTGALRNLGIEIHGKVLIFGVADLAARARFEHKILAPVRALAGEYPDALDPEWWPTSPPEADFGVISGFRVRDVLEDLTNFLADRLKVQQREAGVRHDLIDAVFALGGEDDLVRLLARVKALQAFVETRDGADLLAGYRRAANILRAEAKKDAERHPGEGRGPESLEMTSDTLDADLGRHDEEGGRFSFPYVPDAAEQALAEALDTQIPRAEQSIAQEQFADAMTALSVIRPAIDRFFDDVTVNSPDGTKRTTRLQLLDKFRAAMHKIADFSKIEG